MKILVLDTQGGLIPETYGLSNSRITINSLDPEEGGIADAHPHGLMVGYLFAYIFGALADPIKVPGGIELSFGRIFDERARPLPDFDDLVLRYVAYVKPDIIIRSWGIWDKDDIEFERRVGLRAGPWIEKYKEVLAETGALDFSAAGNSDDLDLDNDIDFPQRLMSEQSFVVGSCRRDGVPSTSPNCVSGPEPSGAAPGHITADP